MSTKSRCFVFIDGSNLYHSFKKSQVYNQLEFDFAGFIQFLTKPHKPKSTTYFVGAIQAQKNNLKSLKLLKNQHKLIGHLKRNNIKTKLGFILKTGNTYHEKGVDVQIASDILIGAFKDKYDLAYLVSSDSDLIPAVEAAQEEGKIITYIGFKHKPSYALLKTCRQSRLLIKDDLLPFAKK